MSTTAGDVITQIESIASTKLGSTYQKLRHVLDLEANDGRNLKDAYRARPLGATHGQSITNSYVLNHVFELILTTTLARADNDDDLMTALGVLYDKQDEIYKQCAKDRVNLPLVVLLVTDPDLDEPQLMKEGHAVALRQRFTVRYRHTI